MRTHHVARSALGLIWVVAISALPAQQRPQNRITLEQYLDWEEVQAPQLSPDGSQIAFSRRWVDKMNDRWESSVWVANADGSRMRQLVQGSDVKWSPDGKRIAYIARGEPSGQQIFVRWLDVDGPPPRSRTSRSRRRRWPGRRTASPSRSR
jgi:dipeptidyl aminopeptidase/acylaminoacyl peptidase